MELGFALLFFFLWALGAWTIHRRLPHAYRRALARQMDGVGDERVSPVSAPRREPRSAEEVEQLKSRSQRLGRRELFIYATFFLALCLVTGYVEVRVVEGVGAETPLQYVVGALTFGVVYWPAAWIALRPRGLSTPLSRGLLSVVLGMLVAAVVTTGLGALVARFTLVMALLVLGQLVLGAIALWLIAVLWLVGQSGLMAFRLSGHLLRVIAAVVGGTGVLVTTHAWGNGWSNQWVQLMVTAVMIGIVVVAFRATRERLPSRPLRVVFLRVFDGHTETSGLLRELAGSLSFVGEAQLIAGPDAATTTMDATTLLAFLTGRLRRAFVLRQRDIERAVAAARSPAQSLDSRHPVREVRCGATTWLPAVRSLVADADVIIADARGYRESGGLAQELQVLAEDRLSHRTILLTDRDEPARILGDGATVLRDRDCGFPSVWEAVWQSMRRETSPSMTAAWPAAI